MNRFFIGILIGAGAILPGISSGVFLVVFGLYEKIINTLLHFFKDIKKNFIFLFPIAIGTLLSIFLFSKILLFAFKKYSIYTSYAFIGLILGSVPAIKKQAEIVKPSFFHIICFMLSFVFSIYLIILKKGNTYNISSFSNFYLIFAGFLMSAGIIIPGISKTSILIMLGLYSNYLTAISTFNLSFLFPVGIGLVFGCMFFMYVISFLFTYFKSYTYYFILGFVVGSCFVIYPGFKLTTEYIVSVIIALSCFWLIKRLNRIN